MVKFQKMRSPIRSLTTWLTITAYYCAMAQDRSAIQDLEEILRSYPEKSNSDALARVQSLEKFIEHHKGTEESQTARLIYAADLVFLGFSTPGDSRVNQSRSIFEEVFKEGGGTWQHAYAAVGVIASYDYQGTECTKEDTERQISIALETLKNHLYGSLDDLSNKNLKALKIWSPETNQRNALKSVGEFARKGYSRIGKDPEELDALLYAHAVAETQDLAHQLPERLPAEPEQSGLRSGKVGALPEYQQFDSKRDDESWKWHLMFAGIAILGIFVLLFRVNFHGRSQ